MSGKKGKNDFIKKHEYPGGKQAFQQFLKENLKYPKAALENKIEGHVLVAYSVDFNGKVTSAKVLKGIGYGCDEEALRVVLLLQFAPQNNHGVKISSRHKIKIPFKLMAVENTIQYNYTTSTATKKNEANKTNKSYSYTVKINK
ncbi:MAG: energy transducer TonB [Chitinophagales bacterium]|nr:energy transducer TonB [Chitinophagales bacterium]